MSRIEARLDGPIEVTDVRFAVAVSRFNSRFTDGMLLGCVHAFEEYGLTEESYDVASVPGAVELPLVCQRFAKSGDYAAVIALGAVVRGDTTHYDYVCEMVSSGCLRVSLDTGVPVIFGVITTEDFTQAAERSGENKANKGYEAALAALEIATLMPKLP